MTNKITTKEYVDALKALTYIKKEEEKYTRALKHDNHHFKSMPQIFESTIIKIQRNNTELKKELKLAIKNFLKDYEYNKKLHNSYEEKINILLNNLINNLSNDNYLELDPETKTILISNIDFNIIYDTIKKLITKIYKNKLEINHINDLINLRKISLEIKLNYQKQQNIKPSKKRSRKKLH